MDENVLSSEKIESSIPEIELRGEDVRARINVISEIPKDWQAALARWAKINKGTSKRSCGGPNKLGRENRKS